MIDKNLGAMKTTVQVASIFGVMVLVPAAAGFVPGVWLCDIASQFRLLYPLLLLLCLLVLLACRDRLRAALLCFATIVMTLPVVVLVAPRSCVSNDREQLITLLNFNTEFQHNDQVDLFKHLVETDNPDIMNVVGF